MSSLLPGFSEQLSVRAEQLAAEHQARPARASSAPRRPWRRPHGRRLFVTILIAGLGLGGGAYAGKGIWYPQVGPHRYAEFPGSVDYSPLPAAFHDSFAVLRRDQTDADRDHVVVDLLKSTAPFQGVRTASVRRLGQMVPSGEPIALLSRSRYRVDRRSPETSEALCLWLGENGGGGLTCATPAQAVNGGLDIGYGYGDGTTMHYVSVQPDGVPALRVTTDRGAQVVPVHRNVAFYTAVGPVSDVTRVTRDGRPIRYLKAPGPLPVFPAPLDFTPSIQPSLVQKIMAGVWRDENAKLPADLRLYFTPGMSLGHGIHEPANTATPPPDDPADAEPRPGSSSGPPPNARPGQ